MVQTAAAIIAVCVVAQPARGQGSTANGLSAALDQLGSGELGKICRQQSTQDEGICETLNGMCRDPENKKLAACAEREREQRGVSAIQVKNTPKPIPNPMRLPNVADKAVRECQSDEEGCLTLAEFASGYSDGFRGLSAWCLARKLAKDSGQLPGAAGIAAALVCSTIETTKDLGSLDAEIKDLSSELETAKTSNAPQEKIDALEKNLDDRRKKRNETSNENTRKLAAVPTTYLFLVQQTASVPTYECSGFGLTVPMVRLRHPSKRPIQVSGPLAAGIGGGYYWSPDSMAGCHETWSWGFDFFAYSEGFDLSNNRAQFGVALGVGIVAYGLFEFGVAVGYDLYRQEEVSNGDSNTILRNGLFAGEQLDRPSVSYLLTLTFMPKPPANGEKAGE